MKLTALSAILAISLSGTLKGMSRQRPQTSTEPRAIGGHDGAAAIPAAQLPEWDVISVKQSDASKCQGMGMGKTPVGVDVSCVPLVFLIQQAYGISEENRIVGAPEWAKSSGRYDIQAKVADKDAAAFDKLGQKDTTRMLQSLLADRFSIKVHTEKRDMPVYNLVIAKGGPKLKKASSEESAAEARLTGGIGRIEAVGGQVRSLPFLLSHEVGRPVVDKTGLTGKYDFILEFAPSRAANDDTGRPSVFTALEEQLGLKLEPAKEPMDVLVIDHLDKPLLDAWNPSEKSGECSCHGSRFSPEEIRHQPAA